MEGQTLSHYKVLEKLGGGGMGVVYKALDTKLNRHVALKFLPPELTRDDDARERFMREAQAASALDHPNICTIYEIDNTPDGQLFIAMGYYEGETLKERSAKGPMAIETALDIAIQMAQGLAEAHAADIVHRDIKPANVMITKSGLVKIVDFGIAKLLGVTGPTQTGTTLGTVSYMSPEQIAGKDADQQSDVWALGAVLYEMLTGEAAFKGEHQWAVMNAITNHTPASPRSLRAEMSTDVDQVVMRALEKSKARRYPSAQDFLTAAKVTHADLTRPVATASADGAWRTLRAPKFAVPAVLVFLALGVFGIRSVNSGADVQWAREEALPEIQRFLAEDDYLSAFVLAEEAEQHIPDDPLLAELWPDISAIGSIHTEPPQTDVYFRPYGAGDDDWRYVGQTPLENVRLPRGEFQWRLAKEGFEPRLLASTNPSILLENSRVQSATPLSVELSREGDAPEGMVHVSGGAFPVSLAGTDLERIPLDPFYIGRHEVTNNEFQEFVDQGGYENPEYWEHLTFVKDGDELPWEQAVAEFLDSTAQPGPSTWELGDYPPGEAEYPVRGVSWFEAAAYARFSGKQLPTVVHWARAALPPAEITHPLSHVIVPLSNFGGEGAAAVGTYQGVGPWGTYDTAGNVREWTWNEAQEARDRRVILGGGWNDPAYMATILGSEPAFDRSEFNGFRLAEYLNSGTIPAELSGPFARAIEDLDSVDVVSDEVFEVFVRQASYSATPLNAEIDATDDSSEYWVRQKISLDTSSSDERVPVYLFLPKEFEPPYQPVVVFPGSGVFGAPDSSDELQPYSMTDFLVRDGRALVWPIYEGSFERWTEQGSTLTRDRTFAWRREVGRTLDYLATRDDMDLERVGYFGLSFGASSALPLLALEERLKVAVLYSGGLIARAGTPPEALSANYVPHITIPVLMLNGTYDYIIPLESAQIPLFERLGTPAEDKRRVVFDAGHNPLPRNQVIREAIAWLDKFLGPVN